MSRRKRPPPHGAWATFRVPLVVGAMSLAGLVGALLGDGAWDEAGAILLAAPVVVFAWARAKRAL